MPLRGLTGPIFAAVPSGSVVHAPGAGVTPRTWRSTMWAGSSHATYASAARELVRVANAVIRLRNGCRKPADERLERVHHEPTAYSRKALQQLACGIERTDPFGKRPNNGPRVETLVDEEGRGARNVVPCHDGALDWCRASPCRQHGEVQVDPPVRGGGE